MRHEMILTKDASVKTQARIVPDGDSAVMTGLLAEGLLPLLTELKAAYHGFPWESELWAQARQRRSPYRTLALFGLSARTRDALLSDMCRRFFQHFPDAMSLWRQRDNVAECAAEIVRPRQLAIVESMAKALEFGAPSRRQELLRIKGVGEKIAECVLAYGWGQDALPLDAHCIRVLARVFGLPMAATRLTTRAAESRSVPSSAPGGIRPGGIQLDGIQLEARNANRLPSLLRESLKYVYLMQSQRFRAPAIGMVDIHEILRLHGQVCCARKPQCARCPVAGCLSRREPWDRENTITAPPALWDDWRELINEPAGV